MNGKLTVTLSARGRLKATLSKAIERVGPIIKPIEITENGEYTAPENVHGFNPVKVDVPLKYDEGYTDGYQASQGNIKLQEKTTTENGEVVTDEGYTGMSKVVVAVPIKEEQTKALDVSENGSYNIFPDEGKVLSAAYVNVNIPPKEEQEKTVEITANGTVEVVPDEGKTLSKVTANVNVASTGEVGKPYIDTSKITNFSHFCRGNRMNNYLENLDTSNGTSFANMFQACYTLKTIPLLKTSNGSDFSNMFTNCSRLEMIPQLDTSKGSLFGSMFYGCSTLVEVPLLDTSKGTNFIQTFYNCTKLETVSITTAKSNFSSNTFQNCTALKNITIGEGWAVNIYLHYSNSLTVESLHGMIENLADMTGQTAKTFQIGATNLAKIDEAHIEMLKAKNWNYS